MIYQSIQIKKDCKCLRKVNKKKEVAQIKKATVSLIDFLIPSILTFPLHFQSGFQI